jgi:pyruvate dehydrogenase E2 component (dihydrolipoamide acetyltransferase)
MPDVVMPRLSDSMEEGTILKWLVDDGQAVSKGEELVEIETDKATMTYEADSDGLVHHVAREGDTLPIGATIARILVPGEAPQSNGTAAVAAAQPAAESDGGRAKASPVARRIARERGIDLGALVGSGPGGRIVKADVENAAAPAVAPAPAAPAATPAAAPAAPAPPLVAPEAPAAPPPAVAPVVAGTAKGEVTVQELSRTQQTIARRMAESKATIPEFTLQATIDMHEAVALRTQLKTLLSDSEQPLPSINDLIVKACALALREYPRANGAYKDGRFELYSRINVGVAVATPDTLLVPTIFDADHKSLGQIARETRTLAQRVRDNQITPPELSGATFTVSNLGMYAITDFTAVINPPQAAILAVGTLQPQPVIHDTQIVARHQMHVTLSCDHRILYGAQAAQFLTRIRDLLQTPLTLTL